MANQSITVELDEETIRCLTAVGKPIDVLARLAHSAADGVRNRYPQRDQTDVSLRIERAEADDYETKESEANEKQVDALVLTGRHRVDEIAQAARDDAARQRDPQSITSQADSEFDRARAVLEDQRSSSDVALEHERSERRRSRTNIRAAERQATDNELTG